MVFTIRRKLSFLSGIDAFPTFIGECRGIRLASQLFYGSLVPRYVTSKSQLYINHSFRSYRNMLSGDNDFNDIKLCKTAFGLPISRLQNFVHEISTKIYLKFQLPEYT